MSVLWSLSGSEEKFSTVTSITSSAHVSGNVWIIVQSQMDHVTWLKYKFRICQMPKCFSYTDNALKFINLAKFTK